MKKHSVPPLPRRIQLKKRSKQQPRQIKLPLTLASNRSQWLCSCLTQRTSQHQWIRFCRFVRLSKTWQHWMSTTKLSVKPILFFRESALSVIPMSLVKDLNQVQIIVFAAPTSKHQTSSLCTIAPHSYLPNLALQNNRIMSNKNCSRFR